MTYRGQTIREQTLEAAMRAASMAGPVKVTMAVRCECGQWMRPGRDHTCRPEHLGGDAARS